MPWVYSHFGPESGGGGMADALVSGASDRKVVEVQLLSAAPRRYESIDSTPARVTTAITLLAGSITRMTST